MKEIIYLEEDFLHSFLAQKNNGLPTNINTENQEKREETHQQTAGTSTNGFTEITADSGEVKVPGIFKTPSGKVVLRIAPNKHSSETYTLSELEAGKEIISKRLHDNALASFEESLKKDVRLKELDNAAIGDYAYVKGNFRVVDLNYLDSLLSDDFFTIAFGSLNDEKQNEIQAIKNNTSMKEQAKKNAIKKINENYDLLEEEQKKPLLFIKTVLSYLKEISPVEAFLILKNAVIPLKQTYLRETAKELQFKYGSDIIHTEITGLGKVTQFINSDQLDFNFQNISAGSPEQFVGEFQNFFIYCFNTLGLLPEKAVIMSPVAIYFE